MTQDEKIKMLAERVHGWEWVPPSPNDSMGYWSSTDLQHPCKYYFDPFHNIEQAMGLWKRLAPKQMSTFGYHITRVAEKYVGKTELMPWIEVFYNLIRVDKLATAISEAVVAVLEEK